MKVVVTGGANGIGREAVEELLERGHDLVVLDNDSDALNSLSDDVEKYDADVRTEEAADILENRDFDVLVNSAGIQKQGAVEDAPISEFEEQIETNYLGTVRAVKASLPVLRRNDGRIVNISSLAGRMTQPFLSGYSASKYAVEGFTDALRMELLDSEVEVVLVEPGPVKTGFNREGAENFRRFMPESRYSERYGEKLEGDFEGIDPEKAARAVVEAVEADDPKIRYRPTWRTWLIIWLEKFLPQRIYDRLA